MKTLYLLRHTKSDQDLPLADRDRPLAPRGRKACKALGRHLKAVDPAPGLVLCSTARRARETWEGVSAAGKLSWPVEWRDDLYLAPASRLFAVAKDVDDAHGAAMIVAHNPGLEELARRLTGPGSDREAVASLVQKYPTGGLACIVFLVDRWADLSTAKAHLDSFVTPRGLGED